jgi:hypothetical protein
MEPDAIAIIEDFLNTRYKNYISPELQRLIDANSGGPEDLPLPDLEVRWIPNDQINLDSPDHQIRGVTGLENETLTSQVEGSGLINPIVLMPFKGKLVPTSGHTRDITSIVLTDTKPEIATKWGINGGIFAYVYKEEITDLEVFFDVAFVLNDHPEATANKDEDFVKSILNLYYNNNSFTDDNGNFDHNKVMNHIKKRMPTTSSHKIAGICTQVKNQIKKDEVLNDYAHGCIKMYRNKQPSNGKLFERFDLSNETKALHYVRTQDGIIVNMMCGLQPSQTDWLGGHVVKIQRYVRDVRKEFPSEQILDVNLYMHLTKVEKEKDEMTAKECLKSQRDLVYNKLVNDVLDAIGRPDCSPTKLKFIPQFQISLDEDGNEQFGEEVIEYAV